MHPFSLYPYSFTESRKSPQLLLGTAPFPLIFLESSPFIRHPGVVCHPYQPFEFEKHNAWLVASTREVGRHQFRFNMSCELAMMATGKDTKLAILGAYRHCRVQLVSWLIFFMVDTNTPICDNSVC